MEELLKSLGECDLKRFIELYASFGIVLDKAVPDKEVFRVYLGGPHYPDEDINDSEKFDGYHGFYTVLVFDKTGKFISQGFWE